MRTSYELDRHADELRDDARRLLVQIAGRCKEIGKIGETDVSSAKWRNLVTNGEAVELATLLLSLVDKKQRYQTVREDLRRQRRKEQRESDEAEKDISYGERNELR